MDTLPQLPRSSTSYLWEQDTHVDVSFCDGRFTGITQLQTLPRGFDYSPQIHAGSQGYSDGPPLIDINAWETLSYHSSKEFPCNSPSAPDHWQYSYLPPAGREYPTFDNYVYESTQREWMTTPVDAHPPRTSFVLGPPSPSVPHESHMPLFVDGGELHSEDRASNDMFRCPLLSSDGTYCDALIPCNEADITTHLRSIHALRSKRLEVIGCLWPGCKCCMQAASIPRHIMTLHVKTRFQCSYCGKSLTRKDGKLKHEKICHGKP